MGLLGDPPTKKMDAMFCLALLLLQLFSSATATKSSVNDTYILWNKVNTVTVKAVQAFFT